MFYIILGLLTNSLFGLKSACHNLPFLYQSMGHHQVFSNVQGESDKEILYLLYLFGLVMEAFLVIIVLGFLQGDV